MVAMETKLMAALATIAALSLHHLSLAIAVADHTRVFSNSSAGFSLPLFTKPSPNRAIRRGTDGFLYLQHNLTAASVTANFTAIAPENNRHHVTEVHFGTGNGKRKLLLELDSRGPITWIQCIPCRPAATQTGPMFDGEASPTFRHVDSRVCRPPFRPDPAISRCLFTIKGAGGLMVKGLVSLDEYTREADGHVFPNFIFGCAHETWHFSNINTYAGVLAYRQFATQVAGHGLTRSSYCLFREVNRQGFLRFGDESDIPNKPHYQTTRILPVHGDVHESAYHVSLVGVSLGESRLDGVHPEMFARRKDGQGGSIIDVVEQAGYGLCVRATEAIKGRLQPMSLHFAEEEATLVISPKQLFLMVDDKRAGQIACLAMRPGRRNVIGTLQQVDTRFVYDLKEHMLSFAPESCIQDTVPVA
nr:unnamed protein product [Digitaria exilis]